MMGKVGAVVLAACSLGWSVPALAGPPPAGPWASWLGLVDDPAGGEKAPPPAKAPPLPLHTLEGVGGGCIVPMAYLVNPGPKGSVFGLPAASVTYLVCGRKNAQTLAVTETLFGRIELGYAAGRFGLGSLPDAVEKITGVDIHDNDVWLHNFNIRGMLLEENSFNLPLPAVTAGVHVKYNEDVRAIDGRLGGAVHAIGFERSNGTDFTLTASKTVVLGRPFILTAGMRNSQGAQLGYLGFSDHCATTFEGSAICLATDWLAVGYEFRQKTNPYDRVNNLIGDEDNWHVICAGLILGEHLTLAAGWAHLGNVGNSDGSCAWALQLKYEF